MLVEEAHESETAQRVVRDGLVHVAGSHVPAAACPAGTKAGQAYTATSCQACGAATGTGYLDASGAAKQGFCVCSKGVWSCGTTAEWPCYPQTTGATVPASCN
jgi:hypothetical protein